MKLKELLIKSVLTCLCMQLCAEQHIEWRNSQYLLDINSMSAISPLSKDKNHDCSIKSDKIIHTWSDIKITNYVYIFYPKLAVRFGSEYWYSGCVRNWRRQFPTFVHADKWMIVIVRHVRQMWCKKISCLIDLIWTAPKNQARMDNDCPSQPQAIVAVFIITDKIASLINLPHLVSDSPVTHHSILPWKLLC